MGFLTSIKQTFNISGMEVAVVTDDDVYSQFDRVSGNVVIRGGEYEQSGQSIKLELKEFWTETRSTYTGTTTMTTTVTVSKARAVASLAKNFSIKPRSEQSYPFEVQLPINCRISTKDTGWKLEITIDIPGAKDPKGTVILNIQPAEEFLAIIHACELGMRFREEIRFRRWDKSTGVTRFRLIPSRVLEPELDYVQLELLQNPNGAVTGSLIFDLQEQSITDYFKAIFNLDRVKKPITLARDEIFLPDGEINQVAITRSIGRCLQEVISERHK